MKLIKKKDFLKIDFKAVWPRDGHADSLGVNRQILLLDSNLKNGNFLEHKKSYQKPKRT